MKIKTKKEFNLVHLIQWGWDNNIEGRGFFNESGSEVYFSGDGKVSVDPFVSKDDTFSVNVEEEITEDTKIPKLLMVYADDRYIDTCLYDKCTINYGKNDTEDGGLLPLSFHYLHEDGTMTLLWKDGEMV